MKMLMWLIINLKEWIKYNKIPQKSIFIITILIVFIIMMYYNPLILLEAAAEEEKNEEELREIYKDIIKYNEEIKNYNTYNEITIPKIVIITIIIAVSIVSIISISEIDWNDININNNGDNEDINISAAVNEKQNKITKINIITLENNEDIINSDSDSEKPLNSVAEDLAIAKANHEYLIQQLKKLQFQISVLGKDKNN